MKSCSKGVINALFGLMAGIAVLGFIGCGGDSDNKDELDGNPVGSIKPIAELTVEDAEASESGDVAVFKVTLDRPAATDLTIRYSVDTDSTATPGTDYVELSGTVIIPSGSTFAQVTVIPVDDNEVDGIETVVISLSRESEYNLGADWTAAIEITSDDAPQLTVTTDTPVISENGGTGSFTMMLSEPATSDVTFKYHIRNKSTAISGVDYQTLIETATIIAGSKTTNVQVQPIDDNLFESDETVTIELLSFGLDYEPDFPTTATIVITSDELPVVDIVTALDTATENGTEGIFLLTIPAPVNEDLVVEYEVSGTATNEIDYRLILERIVIPAGQTTVEIVITPLADSNNNEGDEFVTLQLVPGEAYDLGSSIEATVTINDYVVPVEPQGLPFVTVDVPDNIANKDGDTGTVRFSIDQVLSNDLIVYVAPETGGAPWAIPGFDYDNPPSQVTIHAGQTSTAITITPITDSPVKANRVVMMEVRPGPGYRLADDFLDLDNMFARMVTIVGQAELPQVRLVSNDAIASWEGDIASFTVEIDRPQSTPTTVYYQLGTFAGNATWGEDAELLPGSITIPAGWTSATQEVVTLQDNIPEGKETLNITLVPTDEYDIIFANYFVGLEILGDGSLPTISVEAVDSSASERGLDPATFVVRLDRPASKDLRINIRDALRGSATGGGGIDNGDMPGIDYVTYPADVLVIYQGDVSAELTIIPIDDDDLEDVEEIYFSLNSGPEYFVADGEFRGYAGVYLYSDERSEEISPLVTVTVVDPIAYESDGNAAIFRFMLSEPVDEDVIISYYLNGDAEEGIDFQNLEDTYTIPAGQTFVDIRIIPIDDDLLEPVEEVRLSLWSSDYHVTFDENSPEVQIISDEEGPCARGIAASAIAYEGGEAAVCEIRLDQMVALDTKIGFEIYDYSTTRADYEVVGVTLGDHDYFTTGEVTIPAGSRSAEIRIKAVNDSEIESPEELHIELLDGEGYLVDVFDGSDIYLVSDDAGPVATIYTVESMAIAGGKDAVFEIILNQAATYDLNIMYEVEDWTYSGYRAVYEELSGVATIRKGATSVQVKVKATQYAPSSPGTLQFTLVSGPGYGIARNSEIEIQVGREE